MNFIFPYAGYVGFMRACYVFCVACVFLLENKADKIRHVCAVKCVGMDLSDLYAEVAQVGLFKGKSVVACRQIGESF